MTKKIEKIDKSFEKLNKSFKKLDKTLKNLTKTLKNMKKTLKNLTILTRKMSKCGLSVLKSACIKHCNSALDLSLIGTFLISSMICSISSLEILKIMFLYRHF